MDNITYIKEMLKARGLINMPSDELITLEIKMAKDAINLRRYGDTDRELEKQYSNLVLQLVIAAILKYGAEGETGHTEGGITRQYGSDGAYPTSLMRQVIPILGCLVKEGNTDGNSESQP